WHRRPEVLVGFGVEGGRLAREAAADGRSPLLAHAAGLYARSPGADAGALEDGDTRAASAQLTRDGETDDACADHSDVERAAGHDQRPTSNSFPAVRRDSVARLMSLRHVVVANCAHGPRLSTCHGSRRHRISFVC